MASHKPKHLAPVSYTRWQSTPRGRVLSTAATAAVMAGLLSSPGRALALTVAADADPEVEQGADDVMSSDIAPTTKDEAAEQLEEAKQETQQASDELADATQGKADAQQALDDEQAREDAIAQDAADKNQAVEDTKQSTEATLDEHIEAGEGIFDNGLPRGRYSEWVDQANQMDDLYSEDDAALVQEANDLRDTVAQERQNELDKAATANGEAEASRQRLGGIQTSETVETEVASSAIFQQALSLAMGTAWQSTVLDLANETFVPIYEQFLDLAGRIANKDAVVNVFAGADEGELDDAAEATERYEWMSYYRTDVAKAQAAYATYQDNWNNGGQRVAGDLTGALALLTDAGLGADSWQTRYVQETNTLYAALARANQSTATAAAYASMLGGDDAWTADDRATVSNNPLFVPSMSLNTYHDPDDPTYVYHGMADQADAVLNASEWRSDKLAREFLGGDGAYDAWDQAGRPDLGEAFDAFVATKYAEAHETVAKNVTFDQANPAPSLADLDPNLPNNHLGDLGQAYSDAGTANDLAATNDGTDAEQAALALAEQVRQQAQDKYDAAVLKQAIAQFIYDNWTDPQPGQEQSKTQDANKVSGKAGTKTALASTGAATDPVSHGVAATRVASTQAKNALVATGDEDLGLLVRLLTALGLACLTLAARFRDRREA